MRTFTGISGCWIRGSTATVFVSLLLLAGQPGCAVRRLPDWSEVQAVTPGTRTEVQLYKEKATRDGSEIKGHFLAATDDSVTLKLQDGQDKTLQRESVRRVRIPRPNRWAKWAALGTPPAIVGALAATGISTGVTGVIPAFFGIPVFLLPGMRAIYEISSDQRRKFPPGTSSSFSGVNSPETSKTKVP